MSSGQWDDLLTYTVNDHSLVGWWCMALLFLFAALELRQVLMDLKIGEHGGLGFKNLHGGAGVLA